MPLHVVAHGPIDAPLVVCIHGGMDRAAGFAATARRLAARHRVVTYDRRGYGRSMEPGPPALVADHVADAVSLFDRPGVAIGHSFGGVIAIGAAIARPDLVRAVGVYEMPASWLEWWPRNTAGAASVNAQSPEDGAEQFMRLLVGDSTWERLPAPTRAQRRAEGPALQADMLDLRRGPIDPSALTVPLLVARGTEAVAHHVQGTAWLAEQTGAELVVLDGANHMAHARRPDQFAAFAERVVALADL
jgi:pimeloyl-ACP methyl ester carboxylesterase